LIFLSVARPLKRPEDRRVKVAYTFAPATRDLIPLICAEGGYVSQSSMLETLIKREAKRLRIKLPGK